MILLAASAKAAQFPFSAWLPRAMEGPTPSSAIFYGSLSVHIGAFLLMRTHPFWEHQISIRWLIVGAGLSTAIVSSMIARVQTTIKGQVAYSSTAQIGIIFIEIAAGFEGIALIHFVSNAFLRTYQLLISPSVVTYLIREQFYNFIPTSPTEPVKNIFYKIRLALYILSIKEWGLDSILFKLFFKPLKSVRGLLKFLTIKSILFYLIPIYLLGFFAAYTENGFLMEYKKYLALASGIMALLMVSKAYNERSSSRLAWLLVVFAHFFVDLAVTFNDHLNLKEASIYLSGIIISGIIGYIVLAKVKAFEHHGIGLNSFHGLVGNYKSLAFVFLLSCLGIAGFPITSAFFGEDLILTHVHENQIFLAFLISLTFIINGISVIRIYSRVFLGHFDKNFQSTTDLTI
jgi:formate hydrogenlyase subunit 3/multisubunit Na+/H+ antiporter MnhD subunit